MVISKEWNWAVVKDKIWSEPSEDVYYYANKWKEKGFKTFLDLGCGLGRNALLFAKCGFETYALDLSSDGINILNERAQEHKVNISASVGDINKLPYEDNSFDCLLAYHVISHTDTEGIKVIISEIKRVLKSRGEFFITLCSKKSSSYSNPNYSRMDENTIIKNEEPEMGVPHYYSDLDGVREILKDFEIIRIRHIEDIYEDTSGWHYFVYGSKK